MFHKKRAREDEGNMGNTDSIPVVSQAKSIVQVVTGDYKGAAQTNENFARTCPIASQVTSSLQRITGDSAGARETERMFGSTMMSTMMNAMDGTPGLGHVKGALHYAVGDDEAGRKSMLAASRTTTVMASGVAGMAAGPVGAVLAGMEGGMLYDMATTEMTGQDQGNVAALKRAVEKPNAGNWFDACAGPAFDGLTGYKAGTMAQNAFKPSTSTSGQGSSGASSTGGQGGTGGGGSGGVAGLENQRLALYDKMEGLRDMPGSNGEVLQLAQKINQLTSQIDATSNAVPSFDPKIASSGPSFRPQYLPNGHVSSTNRERSVPRVVSSYELKTVRLEPTFRSSVVFSRPSATEQATRMPNDTWARTEAYNEICEYIDMNSFLPPGSTREHLPDDEMKEIYRKASKIANETGDNEGLPDQSELEHQFPKDIAKIASENQRDPKKERNGKEQDKKTTLIRITNCAASLNLNFTGYAALGNERMGLRHALFRHGAEFRNMGLKLELPKRVIEAIEMMTPDSNGDSKKIIELINRMIKQGGELAERLLETAELDLAKWLYNNLTTRRFLRKKEVNGSTLVYWVVPRAHGGFDIVLTVFRNIGGEMVLISAYTVMEKLMKKYMEACGIPYYRRRS